MKATLTLCSCMRYPNRLRQKYGATRDQSGTVTLLQFTHCNHAHIVPTFLFAQGQQYGVALVLLSLNYAILVITFLNPCIDASQQLLLSSSQQILRGNCFLFSTVALRTFYYTNENRMWTQKLYRFLTNFIIHFDILLLMQYIDFKRCVF